MKVSSIIKLVFWAFLAALVASLELALWLVDQPWLWVGIIAAIAVLQLT